MSRLFAIAMITIALPSSFAFAGTYAPLNCNKANIPAEQAICANYGLGQQEARVATLFAITTSLVAMGQRGNIQDAQRAWLQRRDACGGNVSCLKKIYDERVRQLNGVIEAIASRGPF